MFFHVSVCVRASCVCMCVYVYVSVHVCASMCACVSAAAGGAPERPEAAEDAAEETTPGDEGERPAPERTQPGGAGAQQAGGALSRTAATQQDPEGKSPTVQLSSFPVQ